MANTILLPHIMCYNADYTSDKFHDIACVMDEKAEGLNPEEVRDATVDAIFSLNRDYFRYLATGALHRQPCHLTDRPAEAQYNIQPGMSLYRLVEPAGYFSQAS